MEDQLKLEYFETSDITGGEMNLNHETIKTKTDGVALVISNEYTGSGDREIPECKKSMLHENSKKLCTFLKPNYFVCHKQNIAKQEFMQLCKRLAEYKYPSNCKRLVVAFSGCGFDGVLHLRDGERIFLEDVVGFFKSTNTNTLFSNMIRIFFIDTYHMSSVGSLIQDDSVIIKAGDDCGCLRRIEMEENVLVAYSSIRYHNNDDENFNLYGKWTCCLAEELERSRYIRLQNILFTVNKAMAGIATAQKYFQTANYCSLTDCLYILPLLYANTNPVVDVSSSLSR